MPKLVPKRALTDRAIIALKPRVGQRYEVLDAYIPGLAVRVSDQGHKSFVLIARYPGSPNPTRRTLGQYGAITLAAARKKAQDWHELLANGIDPADEMERQQLAEQRRRASSFAAVAEDFIVDKLSRERWGRHVERDLRRLFVKPWGDRPIADITSADVRLVVRELKREGKERQAHNQLALIRRFFGWAIEQGEYGLEASPVDRIKPEKLIGKKAVRTRVLRDDELRAYWLAADGAAYPYGAYFRFLAVTGQRKQEVADARWSEFDLDKKLWTIPAARMKADAAHVVPLSPMAMEILSTLPRFGGQYDFVFTSSYGERPISAFSREKIALDAAMLIELRAAGKNELEPFVIHDIRRTMRTHLSALPIPDLVRELVIAHTKPGLHKVYDQHAYLDEKRHALELWAQRLHNVVEPRQDNVVPLRGA
jgi:integrase